MAPVKIIVQGLPLHYKNCTCLGNCMNEDKIKLEKLLATYGPVMCTYLWADEAAPSTVRRNSVRDNFAHVIFKNYEDSIR